MNNKKYLLLILMSSCVFAQQSEDQSTSANETVVDPKKKVQSRSGYKVDDIGYGGQSSVGNQLYRDDLFVSDDLRFPEFDKSIQPYYEWKKEVLEQYDLQLGQDYTSLFQKASDSLTDEDSASGGVYRFYGRWFAAGADEPGALVFKIENSHSYGAVSPDSLGTELGYLGSTGTQYTDLKWVLNDLNWQHRIKDGKAGFVFGRFDANDFMDVIDYENPWTTFQNSNILENHSIAIPETSFGFGVINLYDKQWFIKVAISDANGKLDDIGVFEQGAEFFSFAEVGWTPSADDREFKDIHITVWHVDERVNEKVAQGEGVAIGASWTFDKELMLFARTGQSSGSASDMKRSTTVGFGHTWKAYFDVFGLAVNYSEPVDQQLSDQTTMEMFLRIQLAQNIAITPSFQLLINPSLNPQQDHIQIYGLRFRITL